VLVGRDSYVAALERAWEAAAGGKPQVVLVGAEAGGGKSRLVSEFTARVKGRAVVLSGGCVILGSAGLPYAPIITALRGLVRERGVAGVTALLPGDDAGELSALVPELGSPPVGGDPETAQGRLFGLLLVLLEQLAAEQTLVVVIEDLHWADRSTGELLAFLVRNLGQAPVLMVATFRSDELGQAQAVGRLLSELGRLDGVTRLELQRLSRGQVAAQLEAILGYAPDPAVVTAAFERGAGNPLFTEVLLNPDGTVAPVVPGPARELLLGAVTALPVECQRVLRAAAVGGARIGHRLLTAVTGLEGEGLDDALRPAVGAAVLTADEAGYAFRHELFREAVMWDLLPGERAGIHRAYAGALQADPSLSLESLPSVQLALHWRGAGKTESALRAARDAAAAAAATFAYAEQLQMLELVLDLWEAAPDTAGPVATDKAEVMQTAAEAARLAGEPQRGLPLVDAAIASVDDAREPELAAWLLRLRAGLRQQLLLPGQFDDLHAALRLAASIGRVRAQALCQLIRALMMRDLYDEARPHASELQALAPQLGDERYRIDAQLCLAQLDRRDRDILPDVRDAAAAARRIGSGPLEVLALCEITNTLEARGESEAAIAAGREAIARARQFGLGRYVTAPIAGNLAESLVAAGQWDEAMELAEDGLSQDLAPFEGESMLTCRGQIAAARGDQQTAERMVRELRALPAIDAETQRSFPLARLDIEVRLAGGDLDGALNLAVAVPEVSAGRDPRYLWPLLDVAMRACGDAAGVAPAERAGERASLRDGLAKLAITTAVPGPVERAHAAAFAAEAARAGGRADREAWEATAAAWEAVGQPYPLACALLRAGEAAAAGGDRGAAAACLSRAADLAAGLGAQPLLEQISRLARRARIELPAAAGPAGPAVSFGLTARELEVLRLVAAGRSNQQIAGELFISPKTASVHVSNILGKLGVASRVEAAATAHHLHLLDLG
jgi:DNA-binding CsgD family transcriptional regulator/tetratricopeptide (TPR) repeat protein